MSEKPHFLRSTPTDPDAMRVSRESGSEAALEPLQLGQRVKAIRLSQNLTLEEASKRTGLARSTLSKIENEQLSPTFAAVNKLVDGLGIDLPQLFARPSHDVAKGGRRDITRKGEGRSHPTATYQHELLAVTLSQKKMVPFRTRVHVRSFEAFGGWVRHDGEEFLYVLEGSILLYTEFYEPVEMAIGDSAYYDCTMGHALISTSEVDAEVLWVTA